jgi:hypothetical protein
MLKDNLKLRQWMAATSLIALVFSITVPAIAGSSTASGTTALRNPIIQGASTTAPNQAPTQPSNTKPPIGSGSTQTPVIPGSPGNNPALPTANSTDKAQTTNETTLNAQPGTDRTIIHLYRTNSLSGTGQRMVQTIRPDQLPDEVASQIASILGVSSLSSGAETMDVSVTNDQLSQIQQLLAPYPNAKLEPGPNGVDRKFIDEDTPATGYPKAGEGNAYDYSDVTIPTMTGNPLPTVRTFCRYLVILGVVAGTIWMSLAATAVVMGHREGGARVVGTAAGLMLLLMGYTIWKIVEINTNIYGGIQDSARSTSRDQTAAVTQNLNPPNVPQVVPSTLPTTEPRSGVPVGSLSGN